MIRDSNAAVSMAEKAKDRFQQSSEVGQWEKNFADSKVRSQIADAVERFLVPTPSSKSRFDSCSVASITARVEMRSHRVRVASLAS